MNDEIEVYEPEARAIVSAPAPSTLFGSDDPAEVIERATAHARALDGVIRGRGLFAKIGNRDHVKVEGWTLLGSMLGVFPVVVWTRELEDHAGWEARVEARTRSGEIVGAAEAECRREENNWRNRDSYALRSMAQTRATSKALRAPLGFIVELAGYQATPAEEMPVIDGNASRPDTGEKPSEAQKKKLGALLTESDKDLEKYPLPPEAAEADLVDWTAYAKAYIKGRWGLSSRTDLSKAQMSELIDHIDKTRIPF